LPDARLGRLVGAHLVVDETVAFAAKEREVERRKAVVWTAGVALFATWNLAVVAGVVVGSAVGSPGALGLDAAFPAVLVALVLPSLREQDARGAALLGVPLAVIATPALPAGLPPLVALVGVLAALRPGRGRPGVTRHTAGP
jgi:predicted branched-subunit amino acid permease